MNEDQQYNDHKLHINPCTCGNQHEVMGDDFDADVSCDACGAITANCFGTKGATKAWNEGKVRYDRPSDVRD